MFSKEIRGTLQCNTYTKGVYFIFPWKIKKVVKTTGSNYLRLESIFARKFYINMAVASKRSTRFLSNFNLLNIPGYSVSF